MAESDGADEQSAQSRSLSVWAFAAFDTVLFVLVALVPVHAAGALADLLSGLSTLLGFALFGYLWLLGGLAVRWVLSGATLDDAVTTLARRGAAAGGVAGVAFLLGVLVVAVGPGLVAGTIQPLSVLLVGGIGSAVAAVVGSVVGLLLGAADLAVYRVAGYALTGTGDSSAAATPGRR
ncbi:hypothetical protein [Haloarcula onubensis]|uniref:DUF7965 domain-containing protein n=1 Tax=Haloarcula onubensis TaxID=2950539 RepID=A0ABU2FL35_9EURY|nr:hypothetical protein [Halomicroarcula sp. S3CR25-11]MDS0280911.1 hypothetical protein [Halomicroarcula sp. S3CR25-11]